MSPWKLTQLNGPLGSVEDTLHLQQAFKSWVSSALFLSMKADIPLVLLTKFSPEEQHLLHI